jgi:hypothetical protein
MKKYKIGILALAALGLGFTGASAATINLYQYAFKVNSTVYSVTDDGDDTNDDTLPGTISLSSGFTTTGLGNITFTTSGAGAHSFLAFFDHEMVEGENTFFNEFGTVNNTPGANQSWEIDEPTGDYGGDIYTHFENNNLENDNALPSTSPDDVSMAMGWNFNLLAGETATITLTLSDTITPTGFYLAQFDSDTTDAFLYFSGNLNITGGGNPVPEPATMLLMATGLTGLLGARARRKMKK